MDGPCNNGAQVGIVAATRMLCSDIAWRMVQGHPEEISAQPLINAFLVLLLTGLRAREMSGQEGK